MKIILGKNTFEETSAYIEATFLSENKQRGLDELDELPIFTHFTNATDTDHISKVFGDCTATIIENSLYKSGFT